MKKIGIVVGLLVLILALGWAGATYSFASKTELEMDQLLEEANETISARWDFMSIEKSSFEKGFVSSTASTAIYPSGKDGPDDGSLFLKHTIYHGPLAMTPNGPKVCGAYTISVVDWSRLDEDELKTGREIANAIQGALRAEVAKSFFPDESMEAVMVEYVEQGLVQVREDQSGYEFKGDLTNGVLRTANRDPYCRGT